MKYLKPEELVKGKWYKGTILTEWTFLFDCIDNGKIYVTLSGQPGHPGSRPNNYFIDSVDDICEASEQEVLAVFPNTKFPKQPKTTNKEIIGYKVPFDMFAAKYKKGDVLNQTSNPSFYSQNGSGPSLPCEIVETWEPVYEKEYKKGDWVMVKYTGKNCHGWEWIRGEQKCLQISQWKTKGFRTPSGGFANSYDKYVAFNDDTVLFSAHENTDYIIRLATPREIEASQEIKIGEYKVELTSRGVKIGCGHYTVDDIKALKTVLGLNHVDEISFAGNKINLSIINQILKKFHY